MGVIRNLGWDIWIFCKVLKRMIDLILNAWDCFPQSIIEQIVILNFIPRLWIISVYCELSLKIRSNMMLERHNKIKICEKFWGNKDYNFIVSVLKNINIWRSSPQLCFIQACIVSKMLWIMVETCFVHVSPINYTTVRLEPTLIRLLHNLCAVKPESLLRWFQFSYAYYSMNNCIEKL